MLEDFNLACMDTVFIMIVTALPYTVSINAHYITDSLINYVLVLNFPIISLQFSNSLVTFVFHLYRLYKS